MKGRRRTIDATKKPQPGRAAPAPFKLFLAGCLIIAMAMSMGYFTLTGAIDKMTSPSWPGTQARVLSSDLNRQVKSGAWCMQVRYQYLVDHQTFVSSRLSPMSKVACYRGKQVAAAVFERVQPGAIIAIRYDPVHPAKAIVYLDALDFADVLLVGLMLALLPAGIWCVRHAAASIRR
ncbi:MULTISPECIES: DUF3592 domain-containing protein [unclassified Massilia]|uniref:DUF3592 domain-containing protein n=1 Tax=unclassified Massilia TaxID=2609279 RepID=UPI00177C9BA1|nr:DUF3592 domain-containing protein [Massilia sp. CFBP 13647]MBD8674604.1 DUF3592 domain-containing protein [Massilia sp. CFBP 13721]